MYLLLCAVVFLAGYTLNVLTITVGYHRALAHQAVTLSPRARRLLIAGGSWVTGLDPKAWVVMHRLHHAHSDTPQDPHSPRNVGLLGIGLEQLRSYTRVLIGLAKNDPAYTRYATDLDFPLNRLNLTGRWWLPYALHAAVGLALGLGVGPLLGLAWFLGMMSHPVQGGLVNALGHAVGSRNFQTDDDSRNNGLVAWLVFGEGLQNNHHRYPASPRFSYLPSEPDAGYLACLLFERLGVLQVHRGQLLPSPGASTSAAPDAGLRAG